MPEVGSWPRPCEKSTRYNRTRNFEACGHALITDPKPREVCTIYEIDTTERNWAQAVYNFRWVPQTDPYGVVHNIIDYPGVPVDHSIVQENHNILKNVRIPIRPHFGVMGVAPDNVQNLSHFQD
jgi:acetamidase/formamidase